MEVRYNTIPPANKANVITNWTASSSSDTKTIDKKDLNLTPIKSKNLYETDLNDNPAVSKYPFKRKALNPQPEVAASPSSLKKEADGSILYIYDNTVVCSLYLPERTIEVELPKAIFPKSIKYGTSIKLKMAENNGIRMPLILLRTPSSQKMEEGIEEIDSLIDEL